jgi:hypothetical protein
VTGLRELPDGSFEAELLFEVRGRVTRSETVLHLSQSGDRARATGVLRVRQTVLGVEPFTALGGALRVADELEMHFDFAGVRASGPDRP